MSFKKTWAFVRGSWDGVPWESSFTKDDSAYISVEDFNADFISDPDMADLVSEYLASGALINSARELDATGKVRLNTIEFIDEETFTAYVTDPRTAAEKEVTYAYHVEEASTPEQIGSFDEVNRVYYHTVAHLF